ncbi:hypothetical protein DICPUDRAFT_82235 [Dictyostelium purpureum]|uniref:Uncharacterized protein n=1 Tax=Dictyostelium purpureum TaxID=5786 RepID=F0ZVX4_DICPU|nr:uncharacterized protein DICPUDRAFT_82235 [Dictyostelium purpureum]EGC31897.1 hypothetical protein DICPUDRAFT_82235 [Dictyostelium purpureum]|eukprot:XP_003291567.1 hypothetical protein DICPUDRAFT_82235 [Dictyostelium purpureum]
MISNLVDSFLRESITRQSNISLFYLNNFGENTLKPDKVSGNQLNFETFNHLTNYFKVYKYNNNNKVIDFDSVGYLKENLTELVSKWVNFYNETKSDSIIFIMDQSQYNQEHLELLKQMVHQLLNHKEISPNTKAIFLLNKLENDVLDPSKLIIKQLELFKLEKHWFIHSGYNTIDSTEEALFWLSQNLEN